ncbi:MAG: guanylate kinase [Candidatus Rhabdochlamydia sp.]
MNSDPLSQGLLFVISGPAGSGKTTLVSMLTEEYSHIKRSISCTTRAPRHNEEPGRDYIFLTPAEFQKKQDEQAFLESATVFDHAYGTLKKSVDDFLHRGYHVVLVIDVQGALAVKKQIPQAILIFISPPSLEVLNERLLKRKTDSPESIEKRIAAAYHELEMISHYDYHVPNGDLSVAYPILKSVVIAEENRIRSP